MKFTMVHTNFNVTDMEKSTSFYNEALGMKVAREKNADDGSFRLVFLEDETGNCQLELTYVKAHPQKYDLGENEMHVAFTVDDFAAAHALHEGMGCICYENKAMGIYFINDPDNYWLEIIPKKRG